MNRRQFLGAAPAAVLLSTAATARAAVAKLGILYMNRIGPKTSELYIANADGSNERKLLPNGFFEYHGAFSPDGKWVLFTSERNGLGNADIYRVRPDGTGLELLTGGPHIEDAATLSPDGSKLAFVSSRDGYFANIWVMDLRTKKSFNLTGKVSKEADESLPHGFFRPTWSPDGQWIAFSSDKDTDWRGHDNGAGWEHTQELSIYAMKLDGTGFRRIAAKPEWCLGTPRWSPDGKRIAFYEMTTEHTWGARRPEGINEAESQIVSVDVMTGARQVHTSGPGMKCFPQWLNATDLAYHRKGGKDEGLRTTTGQAVNRELRSPAWSPDGRTVVYEKVSFRPDWPVGRPVAGWDAKWDYRFIDVFPVLANDGTIAFSEQQAGGSITIMNPDGTGRFRVYDAPKLARTLPQLQSATQTVTGDGTPIARVAGQTAGEANKQANQAPPDPHAVVPGSRPTSVPNGEGGSENRGVAKGVPSDQQTNARGAIGFLGAYFPAWSPDSQWLAFGVGQWFQQRRGGKAVVVRCRRDGTKLEALTDGSEHSGFPSYSADGKKIVFRVWGEKYAGLRILDLDTRKITTLTTEYDNLPQWSPDGSKILFTRRVDAVNFDVYTIKPDGSDLVRLTTNRSNDGHCYWTADGKQITWDSGYYGFREEAALYDNTFQTYGQIWIMNADGTDKRMITDSLWEDTFGLYMPNALLKKHPIS